MRELAMKNHGGGWRSRVGVGLVAAAMVLSGSVGVDAQASGDPIMEAAIDVTQGPPGTVVQVTGRCMQGGYASEEAYVRLYHRGSPGDTPYDTFHRTKLAESDGTWSMAFTVPLDMPRGPAGLTATCSAGDAVIPGREFDFLVTDPEVLAVTPPGLPRRGTPRFTG